MVAATLDQASDNNVAEIMDAEDPLFILTLPVLPENQKEWYTLQQVIWYTAYTFKNVFNYEDNDIFCVPLILVGLRTFLYSLRTVIEWSYDGNFRRRSVLSRFSFWQTIEKHKVTQFYTAPTAIRAWQKKASNMYNDTN
jgi:acetyl-CoA synthetase